MIERLEFKGRGDSTLNLFGCIETHEGITAQAIHASQVFRKGTIFNSGFDRFKLLEGIPQANFLFARDINLDKDYLVLRRIA